jgi:LacI family transcriptional regulator
VIIDELKRLRQTGKHVMALVSDVESSARWAYLGIDNRAAGNVAAYVMGRHLEARSGAEVAVVVGSFSYRCHEDREIGFRSIMRQQFERIEVLEVIKGKDSDEATYNAARKLLQVKPNIAGGLQCRRRQPWLSGGACRVTTCASPGLYHSRVEQSVRTSPAYSAN